MTISSTALARGGERAGEHRLLVADDHAEAERQAGGRAGLGGDLASRLFEAAQLGEDGGRQRRARALAGARLAEVAGREGELGVEAQGRLEELGRRLAGAQLVQAEAGVVEELRLARLLGEGSRAPRGRPPGRGRGARAGAPSRRREARLDRGAAGPVRSLAAVGRRFADGQGDDGRGDGGRGGVGVGVVESDCHARVIGRSQLIRRNWTSVRFVAGELPQSGDLAEPVDGREQARHRDSSPRIFREKEPPRWEPRPLAAKKTPTRFGSVTTRRVTARRAISSSSPTCPSSATSPTARCASCPPGARSTTSSRPASRA